MQLEGFEKKDDDGNPVMLHPFNPADEVELMHMDKWIIASFNDMLVRFENYLERYELGLAIGELEKFFWSYCDDYIEIIKNRVYKPEIYGENARKSGLYAAYHTMLGLIKCFAIYIPHVTEEIYQGYYAEREGVISIHKTQIAPIAVNNEFTEAEYTLGKTAVRVIAELRRYKSENNVSLKTELENVKITLPGDMDLGDALGDIQATCVCKNITIENGDELKVEIL
jgi:valyl-tRNA synthetase